MQVNPNTTRPPATRRRGVAMLLVLISLMTAVVVTAAYLASRDNSGAIGDNIADASAARSAAASGLNLAVAMLETETDWREDHAGGVLVSDYAFAQAAIDLTLEDLETNAPPTAETTYVRVLATATSGQIEHDASAMLIVPVARVADVDLAEFAMFAADTIQLRNTSKLMRWSASPVSELGLPVAFGTKSSSFGAISLGSSAMAIDATAWLPPGANANGVSNGSPLTVNALLMPDEIALPEPPEPRISDSTTHVPVLNGGTTYVIKYNDGIVADGDLNGIVNFNFEGRRIMINDDFVLQENARLRVSGNGYIVVKGDLNIHSTASIELVGDSRLRIFVEGDVDIRGYIGEAGGQNSGPNADGLGHADVSRIHLFSVANADELDWEIDGSALVKGNIYAPHAFVRMEDNARLCGRIAAKRIQLSNDATVFYDHALDRRTGYTNAASPIYDGDGRVKPAYSDLSSLGDSALVALANAEEVKVRAVNYQYGSASTNDAVVGTGESTPRSVKVTYNAVTYDTAVADWEK